MEGPVGFEPTTPGLKVSSTRSAVVRRRPSRIQRAGFRVASVHRRLPSYAQTVVKVAVKSSSRAPALELCPRRPNSHGEIRHATVFS